MKKSKLIYLFILILVLSAVLVACNYTDDDVYTSEELEFTLNEDGESYSLSGIGGYRRNLLTIPSSYNGLPVTRISDGAISGGKWLESITIPGTVTSIGENAFYDCVRLNKVTIGSSVTEIGANAFCGCTALATVKTASVDNWLKIDFANAEANPIYYSHDLYLLLENKNLSSLSISKANTVKKYAFINCTGLNSLTTEEKAVTNIEAYAFSGCTRLSSIQFDDALTTIGDNAFSGCSELETLTIAKGVTDVGNSAFENCTKLETVNIPANVIGIGSDAFNNTKWYDAQANGIIYINNVLYKYKGTMPSNTAVDVKEGTVSISPRAFENCTGLSGLTVASSVKKVGEFAFENCTGIKTVNWNAKACTSAGSEANPLFGSCNNLTTVNISEGVSAIPSYTFKNCANVTNLTVPSTVTSVGNNAFAGCVKLSQVNWNAVTCTGAGSAEYPIFDGCGSLSTIKVNDGVTTLPSNAFKDCTALNNVTVPSSVTIIGDYAFYNTVWYNGKADGIVYINDVLYCYKGSMPNNTAVEVREGIVSISPRAFENYTGLTSIKIASSVFDLGRQAFNGCTELSAVYITDVANWCSINFGNAYANPLSYARNLYLNGSLVTNLVIPDGVAKISGYSFYNCDKITDLIIPDSVTSVGIEAFYACNGITSVSIPENVESLGGHAFRACEKLGTVNWNATACANAGLSDSPVFNECNNLTTINIGANVTNIPSYAFENCDEVTSVLIPAKVSKIGTDVFAGCTKLESISVADSNANFVGQDGVLYSKTTDSENKTVISIFEVPNNIKGVVRLIDGLKTVSNKAFYNRVNITGIDISQSVTNISGNAFGGCVGISEVTIPAGVTSIGDSAFENCTKLGSVNWNATDCSSAGNGIFNGCEKLTTINIDVGVKSIPEGAFGGCAHVKSITIPKNVSSIGKDAFKDCASLENFIVASENKYYVADGGILYKYDKSSIVCVPKALSGAVTVLSSVYNIDASLFEGCSNITSIRLSSSVRSIGEKALKDCVNLAEIRFDGTVEQWNSITKGTDWDNNLGSATENGSYVVYCSDGQIAK